MRLRCLCFLILAVVGALFSAAPAAAHQDTTAYSRMVIHENGDVEYALKIPVEDLGEALGRRDHAALNAPEVRAVEDRLFRYFQPLVGMTADGAPCPVERSGLEVPEDERLYAELRFLFRCPADAPVTLDYRVFFDIDPAHVGMLEVETPGGKTRAELIIERPRWEVHAREDGPPQVEAVGATPARPTAKGIPTLRTQAIAPEPATAAEEPPPAAEPDARRVSNVEEPAKTSRSAHRNWVPIALVFVVVTGSFLAMRRTRRRSSLPAR